MGKHKQSRRWVWWVVAAVCLSLLTNAAVLFVPWGYLYIQAGGRPVIRQHMTIVQHGEWYWNVTVVDFGIVPRTEVRATPTDDPGYARQTREGDYETLSNVSYPDAPNKVVIHESDVVPGWVSFADHDPSAFRVPYKPEAFTYNVTDTAMGWPWRAVRGEMVYAYKLAPVDEKGTSTGLAQILVDTSHGFVDLGMLGPVPYLPIWRGLVFDLLVFMLPWYLLLWGVSAARRRRRLRRGRCVECNYDMARLDAGVVCPECGAERPV